MTPTLLHLLAAYGLCFGLMNDKAPYLPQIRHKAIFLDRMLGCPYCTGFHCGWMVWGLEVLRQGRLPDLFVVSLLLWSFGGAAFCYLADVAAQRLEAGLE